MHICIDASGTRYVLESYADCNFLLFAFPLPDLSSVLSLIPFLLQSQILCWIITLLCLPKGFLKNICAAQKCVHSRLLRTSLCEHMILFWLATPSSFAPILKRQLPEPSIPCYTWYRSCSLPKFYLSIDNSSLTSTVFRFSVCWWCKFRSWFTNVSSLVTFLCLLSLN